MQPLSGWLAILAVAAGGLVPAPVALAQTDDDWEFAEDTALELTVAAARYDAGISIIAQCSRNKMTVSLVGLPATTAPSRRLDATRSDGAVDAQTWEVREGGALSSTLPARDGRFLRVGGELRLRSAAGQTPSIAASFDLPTQHANLDRVLTACGYALEDDRDALPRADPDLRLVRRPSRGSTGGRPGISHEISCIIRDGAYSACRTDRTTSGHSARDARRGSNDENGRRLHPDDAAANEGRVAYIFVPLLLVVYR